MAKPKSKPQLSLECAHVADGAAGIPEEHWSRLFFRFIFGAFDDAQFADMYDEGGRYPVSPSFLAAITILQYLFRASDRVAVDNTVMRRDWRVALGIRNDYVGFCPTVLVRFRQRLVQHGKDREIFTTVLAQLRQLGLLRSRRLRVDATALIADVARLSRADAIQEALRLVVRELHQGYPQLHQRVDFMRLYELYGEEIWLGGPGHDERRLATLAADGRALLALCADHPVRSQAILGQMLSENFTFPEDDGEPPTPLPPGQRPNDHLVTPHEPDVRVGKRRDQLWLGDSVHIVETAEPDQPNFCVDVVTVDPRTEDSQMTKTLAERIGFVVPAADTLIADCGYASAANSKQLAAQGIELIAPPRDSNYKGKYPAHAFGIDFARQKALCPQGHESVYWKPVGRSIRIRFASGACNGCPRRSECTTSKRGRYLGLSRDYDQLLWDRRRATEPQFRVLHKLRAPIEATISELVHCHGLRRSRYRGAAKRALHALFAVTALNAKRMLRCLADDAISPLARVAYGIQRASGGGSTCLRPPRLGGPGRRNPALPVANDCNVGYQM